MIGSGSGDGARSPFYLAMTIGTQLTLWSARIAFLLYVAALAAWLIGKPRAARFAWTSGFMIYLSHVAAAFHFQHHWSHNAAYEETARQTAELFGVRSGEGLYFNYVFTAVWACDVIWSWWRATSYHGRPVWISATIHAFLAFMFFNATVVFVSGWVRWLGVAATVALSALWFRAKRHLAL